MMSINGNETLKRRRLGSPGESAAAADDVPGQGAAVSRSRLEQRMDSMEASFQREISEMKRGGLDLLAKNSAI